jgi:hypothetical protein
MLKIASLKTSVTPSLERTVMVPSPSFVPPRCENVIEPAEGRSS